MALRRHFLRSLVLALIIGLGLFGFVAILTVGLPVQYYPYCGFFTGCAYQPLFVAVDLLFWIGVGYVLVSIGDWVSTKWGEEPFLQYGERVKARFFVALLFFVSAIFSLWVSLWTGAGTFGLYGWYIGATAFAISGSFVIMLPATSEINGNEWTDNS